MKKRILCLTIVVLIIFLFSACNNKAMLSPDLQQPTTQESNRLSIVVTTFPQYDWVRQILGDKANNVELTLLLDDGIDLHSYQPTVEDIAKISACDIFVFVGGESDTWVHDALESSSNPKMTVINMMDVLGEKVKVEEVKEGMEHTHDDDDHAHENETDAHNDTEDHQIADEHEEPQEIEKDEHIWLSLKNAQEICAVIASEIAKLDPSNASVYETNAKEYNKKLSNMDEQYQSMVSNSRIKALLFGDRFPFRYLVDDYGLSYYAAFSGCSAETEASFETIAFLANKADELALKDLIVIDQSNQKIAKTIIENTKNKDQSILVLNPMQSVTAQEIANGATYLSIMESNLEVLKKVLS